MEKTITATGYGMGDYNRIYKNEEGEIAVCTGFHRGEMGTFTTLTLAVEPYTDFDCEFFYVQAHEFPWDKRVRDGQVADWYAIDDFYDRDKFGSLVIRQLEFRSKQKHPDMKEVLHARFNDTDDKVEGKFLKAFMNFYNDCPENCHGLFIEGIQMLEENYPWLKECASEEEVVLVKLSTLKEIIDYYWSGAMEDFQVNNDLPKELRTRADYTNQILLAASQENDIFGLLAKLALQVGLVRLNIIG